MANFISSNKTKIVVSLLMVIISTGAVLKFKKQPVVQEVQKEKKIFEVSVKKISELKSLENKLVFAGIVVGEQEAKITAQTSGTIKFINFDLGDKVFQGKVLATIDDSGNLLSQGKNDFNSAQVRQFELAVEQAKKSYDLAKKNYNSDKSNANRTARDIAKIQYETSKISLDNSLNARTVTAPISGAIISRRISVGDSVVSGQVLATISKTSNSKVGFYLSAEEVKNVSLGMPVKIVNGNKEIDSIVINISPQADLETRKFLVEAAPEKNSDLLLGEVVDVHVQTSNKNSSQENLVYLPLSSVISTQSGSYVFVFKNGIAKKMSVSVLGIYGEKAVIKNDFKNDDEAIVDGNKLLSDGDSVVVNKK